MTYWKTAVTILLLAPACAGCSDSFDSSPITAGGVDGAALVKEGIANLNKTADLAATVTDIESGLAATPQLLKLDERRFEIDHKLAIFRHVATPQQHRTLEKRFGAEMEKAGKRMLAERKRIEAIPGVHEALIRLVSTGSSGGSSGASGSDDLLDRQELDQQIREARAKRRRQLDAAIADHGRDQRVTVEIEELPGAYFTFVQDRLAQATGAESFGFYEKDKPYIVELVPAGDLQAVADGIAFGEVTGVDTQQRTVNVKATAGKLPPPLPPPIHDRDDPLYFQRALHDLTCWDRNRRVMAASAIRSSEVDETLREEIALALEEQLTERYPSMRTQAARALGGWGGSKNVPALFPLLKDEGLGVADAAMGALAAIKDERAVMPIAELLAQPSKYYKATTSLIAMGPMAEKGAAAYVTHSDDQTRHGALKVLEDLGSTESVPELTEVLKLNDIRAVRKALDILAKIRDERAIGDIAEVTLTTTGYIDGGKCLKAYGPVAQRIVVKYLFQEDGMLQRKALDVLAQIATEESVPKLIEFLTVEDRSSRGKALNILAKLKDERAVGPVAMLLLSHQGRSEASSCLIEFGSAAEETVLKGFDYGDASLAVACCRILGKIGTEKSSEKLLQLTRNRDPTLQNAARQAGQKITQRVTQQKQSEPLSSPSQ